MKKSLLTTLTTVLALSAATASQVDALGKWANTHLPKLKECAQTLLRPPFGIGELEELAKEAVLAANELKGIFKGADRAKIAQTVLEYAVREVCPDEIEPWILPLITGPGAEALIEAAFRKLFPDKASPTPVVDASDVEPGGVQ